MMNIYTRISAVGIVFGTLMAGTGCAVYPAHYHDDHGYGPPPHAPAHGYRAKYHNYDLVYDSHLGVYVVVGLAGHYYHDGYYFRHDHDGWYYSKQIDRNWNRYKKGNLPPGLARKYHDNGKSNQKKGREY